MGISREEIHADDSALRNSGFLRFRSADNFALAGRPFGVGSRVAFPLRSDVQRMVRWSGPGISSSRLVGYCFLLQLSLQNRNRSRDSSLLLHQRFSLALLVLRREERPNRFARHRTI